MPTLLLAEASPETRERLSAAARDAGFDVLTAADGFEAVRTALRLRPDAVVLGSLPATLATPVVSRLLRTEPTNADVVVVEAATATSPGDVLAAVHAELVAGDVRRRGRPRYRFDALDLDDDDVLELALRLVAELGVEQGWTPGPEGHGWTPVPEEGGTPGPELGGGPAPGTDAAADREKPAPGGNGLARRRRRVTGETPPREDGAPTGG